MFSWGQGCIWLGEIHFVCNPACWSRTAVQVVTRSSKVICHSFLMSCSDSSAFVCGVSTDSGLPDQFDINYNLTCAEMPWPSVHLSYGHSHFLGMNTIGIGLCIPSPTTSSQGTNIVTPQLIIIYRGYFQLYFQAEIHPLQYTSIDIMKQSFKILVSILNQSRQLVTWTSKLYFCMHRWAYSW